MLKKELNQFEEQHLYMTFTAALKSILESRKEVKPMEAAQQAWEICEKYIYQEEPPFTRVLAATRVTDWDAMPPWKQKQIQDVKRQVNREKYRKNKWKTLRENEEHLKTIQLEDEKSNNNSGVKVN